MRQVDYYTSKFSCGGKEGGGKEGIEGSREEGRELKWREAAQLLLSRTLLQGASYSPFQSYPAPCCQKKKTIPEKCQAKHPHLCVHGCVYVCVCMYHFFVFFFFKLNESGM